MLDFLLIPIGILYVLVIGALFLYGISFFYFTNLSWRKRGTHYQLPQIKNWPRVTVQLPIYNEMYVAERLINAVSKLDYPSHLLEIQVLDDSTDKTVQLVERVVNDLRSQEVDIVHLHRENREGFKAGALAEGMEHARGEFFAIFDADFIPPSDFLRKTIPHFKDENIAFIQTRWGHTNREYSLLTTLQSLAIDAHFVIEQSGRHHAGFWFNFNGTAGIWRRTAIEDAGGWQANTLTEDLDLSYLTHLRGWQALYLRDIEVPAELPVSFMAFRRQQHRWARGSMECAIRFLPEIWKAQVSLPKKLVASLHLTGYSVHLLLITVSLMYPFILLTSQRYPNLIALFGIAFLFNLTAFTPTLYFITAQRLLGRKWWRQLPAILFISILGSGMILNTLRAALQIIRKQPSIFERTPKFGVFNKTQDWTKQRYQLKLDPIVFFELGFALINFGTIILALLLYNWVITIYAAIFCSGLLFTSLSTISQTISLHWRHRDSTEALLASN